MTYEKKNPGSLLSEFSNLIKQNKEAAKEKQQNRKKDFFKKYNLEEGSINLFDELAKLKKETNEAKNSEPEDLKPLEQKVEDLAIIVEQIAIESEIGVDEIVEETPVVEIKPVDSLIEKSVETITKISENTSLFVTPEVEKTPPNFKEIQNKLTFLEKWIYKISAEGPGSGSYWLNDLGDTYHIGVKNATNNQVLTFDSSIGKWTAKGLGQIANHGAFHSDQDTTLTSTVTNNSTTPLPVESTSGFYTSGYLIIGDEIISYTGVTPTSFTGITRAVSGSNSHQHPAGSPVGTAQTAPAGVPSDVRFDVTNISSGVTLNSSNGALTCVSAGTYNFQFSLQLANFGNSPDDFIVWFLRNDVAVPASASYATVPSIHAGIPGSNIITVNIFHAMNAGDTMRMKFASIGGTSVITSYPPSYHLEGVPQSPGVIFTVNQVA